MIERLRSRHVVLLGIGHTNAHVLRMWRMGPLADTDLTCVSNFAVATYSGMLPAVLAGQIPRDQMEIDLVRLCASADANLITDPVVGIDHDSNTLLFDQRPSIPFDVLSIGIGSTASMHGVEVTGRSLVEIKPMQTFLSRLGRSLRRALQRSTSDALRVCVVGGGVAGVEISSCLPAFLRQHTDRSFALSLLTRSPQILPSFEPAARRRVLAEFQRRDVLVLTEADVVAVGEESIQLATGQRIAADLVVWATNASSPPLLDHLGLKLDDRGFIATDQTLRSVSAPRVFAVGDTGTIIGENLPKAGVYAVRQGPVLWGNIARTLDGRPLQPYKPQRSFLRLINLGDGRAVGQWKGIAFSGRGAMWLKDWIDTRFMNQFAVESMDRDDDPMQCRGCGCKLGTESLEIGLLASGLTEREDAAPIGGNESSLIASTDFFSSPVKDSYLGGRIAALHSASDIIASGAVPSEALANVVLPEGAAKEQQRTLQDFLAGARREFAAMGAQIVGGHTIVGPRMEVGFTVIGKSIHRARVRKSNLQVGDRLLLTKPLGIGILLAAHMRNQCRSDDYQNLIAQMLAPQFAYAQIAADLGVTAGTDVTGFGLAGHLIEMLEASNVAAELYLDWVPILDGVAELVEAGIASSLAPENQRVAAKIKVASEIADPPPPVADSHLGHGSRTGSRPANWSAYQVLFDPQTCGGILFGVSEERCEPFQNAAAALELPRPIEVGRVTELVSSGFPLRVVGEPD